MPSCRAALAITGSTIMIACSPPGWLCARRGGVFVSTVMARDRIASRLVEQRHEAAAASRVALRLVGAVLADEEQSRASEPAVLGEAGLHAAVHRRADAADVLLFLAA